MFRKNVAGQFIHFQGVDASTGGIKSGVTWTVRRCIDGTFAAGGGTVTEDSTNGWYKYAMSQADTNGNDIAFNFTGTGAVPQTVNIVTTAGDPTDSVRFGLTALPNAAAGASTGLPLSVDSSGRVDVLKVNGTSQTAGDIYSKVSGLTFTVANQVDVNAKSWAGGTIPAVNVTGVPLVDAKYLLGTIFSTPATAGIIDVNLKNIANAAVSASTAQLGVNVVNAGGTAWASGSLTSGVFAASAINAAAIASGAITNAKFAAGAIDATAIADAAIDRATFAADTGHQTIRSNTAQTGASTSITLDSSASATTDFYTGDWVYLTGATGAGQARLITAYNGSTKVATVAPAWATNPDVTSTFAILPAAKISGVTLTDTTTTVTNQLTAAQIATGIWQDTTAGDFTVASSIGKCLYIANIAPGSANGLATVGASLTIGTNNDKTGYSLSVTPPTASAIATAVWTDTTAGDFTTALSIGKSIMNGVSLGTGLTVNTLTNAPSDSSGVTTLLTRLSSTRATNLDNLDAAISSRGTSTLTQTQVTGGAYSVQSSSCVLGDTRIANLDATVSSRGTSTLTQTQITGGAYNIQSASCVLGDARIAHLDADVSSRGTSTLTQAQVTGGAYALNSASFAFNTAFDFTSTQKTSLNAATPGDSSGVTTLLSRIGGSITISGGKVAATVASGDDADAASIKTTIGVAGAGLTAVALTAAYDAAKTAASATALAAVQTHGDSAWATATSVVVSDKSGFSLASTGLDSIAVTAPSGPATNFRQMVVQTWRRFFKRATKDATNIKTYADDGTTVVTTQAYTSSGSDDDVGAAT
jgi:hypothetical protein